MTILHRREAGLQAVPPESGLSEVPAGCQLSSNLSPGACQVTGPFRDSCPEGDGAENRVLVAVHQVSDIWASPGLQWTLQRERGEITQLYALGRDMGH